MKYKEIGDPPHNNRQIDSHGYGRLGLLGRSLQITTYAQVICLYVSGIEKEKKRKKKCNGEGEKKKVEIVSCSRSIFWMVGMSGDSVVEIGNSKCAHCQHWLRVHCFADRIENH